MVWRAELKSHGVGSPATSDIKPELGAGSGGARGRYSPADRDEEMCKEKQSRRGPGNGAPQDTDAGPRAAMSCVPC